MRWLRGGQEEGLVKEWAEPFLRPSPGFQTLGSGCRIRVWEGLEVWEKLGLGLWDLALNGYGFGCGSRLYMEQQICEREQRDQDSREEEVREALGSRA